MSNHSALRLYIIIIIIGVWSQLKKPCKNDRIRVIGICLHEDFCDRLGLLIGLTQNRPELDDPGYNKDALFAEMAIKFNDPELKIPHSAKWKDAEGELSSYDLLDPNAHEVFRVTCNHNDIEKIYKTSMKPYKDAMKKWVKDTGAGSGEEVRFVTWDQTSSWLEATDTRFQNFDSNRGEWLTWIYILGKQFYVVLWSKYGTMRGIAARSDIGSSGSVAGSDFNSPLVGDNEFVNLVKANMENGRNVMERIAEALQLRISDRSDEKEAAVPDNVCNESTTSNITTITGSSR